MIRPWMPLYIADYLADTKRLTPLEHGVYMLLIMDYWRHGGLPDDDERLARIVGMTLEEWQCVRICVRSFFRPNWHHKRIDAELEKAAAKSKKAQESASKRWKHKVKPKNAKAYATDHAIAYANDMLSQSDSKIGKESQCYLPCLTPYIESVETIDRKRAKREQMGGPQLKVEFERFWSIFPNKVGKAAALKAFSSARKRCELEPMLKALERYIRDKPHDRPYCNPSTWLNQDRWLDKPALGNGHDPQPQARSPQEHWKAYWPGRLAALQKAGKTQAEIEQDKIARMKSIGVT